ncbi:MAG: translation initiation factor aIF-1A [Desulfurococcales archaeon]|nr:translation initiation factor aIF-1A [Desulfurococcales archaeon]
MARGRGRQRERGETPLPDEETIICIAQKILGGGYIQVLCTNGKVLKARIPGKMRRRVWIREGDVLLVAPWSEESDKGDIVHKYWRDEIKKLVGEGYITEEFLEEVGF